MASTAQFTSVEPLPFEGQVGGVRWWFTDRTGGHSRPPYDSLNLARHVGDDPDRVELNLAVITHRLGVPHLATMRPNHGRAVAVVVAAGEVSDVDGLVTAKPLIGLLALGADCTPVVLYDASAGVVAAVHCGWRGLRDDVVGAALERMRALGAGQPTALLGPTICGRCYAVPADRVAEVADRYPSAAASARDGQPSIDIRAGLAERLAAEGIATALVGGCPAEEPDLFSHRRDGRTGRHGAIVALVD